MGTWRNLRSNEKKEVPNQRIVMPSGRGLVLADTSDEVRRDMAPEASIWRISLTEISEAQDTQSDGASRPCLC